MAKDKKKKKKLLLGNHAPEKTSILRMSLYNHSTTSEGSEGESIKLYKRLLKWLGVMIDSPQAFEEQPEV